VSPTGAHWLMQVLPAQSSEQHWLLSLQLDPVPRQLTEQVPFGPHTALQQSLPIVHASPLPLH
jgi:hypothetical protein